MKALEKKKLIKISQNLRILALKIISKAQSSHSASVLSICDILTVLYFKIMNINFKNFKSNTRDKFILSKGHAAAGLYASLYLKKILGKKNFYSYFKNGSLLTGHASHHVEGVEFSTGSLGHGLPVACGIAYSMKLKKKRNKVFVLMSDGELDEGSNWEAILFANHHKLDNLKIIIDRNRLQSIYDTEKTLKLEPLDKKISAFGLDVCQCDGHNLEELISAINKKTKKTIVIIANTIKGKGVKFMENNNAWHYKSPSKKQLDMAFKDIKNNEKYIY